MSTFGGTMVHVGEYHEYTQGCSVHQRDAMIYVGEYPEYIESSSAHQKMS